jgi:hypothetical protein
MEDLKKLLENVAMEGKLSDSELENVAGGNTDISNHIRTFYHGGASRDVIVMLIKTYADFGDIDWEYLKQNDVPYREIMGELWCKNFEAENGPLP